jgi:predicted site-specific integrase-resolvase
MSNDDLMKQDEVARRLRVDRRTLSRWRSTGTGPEYLRVGNAVRYESRSLEDWLGGRKARSIAEEKTRKAEEMQGAQK